MRNLFQKIVRIPFIASMRRSHRIRSDAQQEATVWTDHDQQMQEFYSHFLQPGDLCFDVGANVGNRLKIFRRLGARVIAVEPQRECAQALRRWYGSDSNVTLLENALSDSKGTSELMTSNFHMISSLSKEWMEATQKSGRFASQRWKSAGLVDLLTMDDLIARFGLPRFAKIDVEGFELKVIKGLTRPVPFISLEFTPETKQSSLECLEWLARLGNALFNFSYGESMSLHFTQWTNFEAARVFLAGMEVSSEVWGDIYVSFPDAK